jgi:proline dehydrogenase
MINNLIAKMLPLMPKQLVWIFSKKYISGTTIDDALRESRILNGAGCMVTVDLLGEYITKLSEAEEYKKQYVALIERFGNEGIDGNFSVKPSMFGLLLDQTVCYKNLHEIVATAVKTRSFIRIDMEDSACTEREIEIYRKLKAEFPKNVGLVLQSYLHRTLNDIKNLMDIHTPESSLNFRLCKGIYVEDEKIAFKGHGEIRDHFLDDLKYMFENDIYVGIATHDKYLVDKAIEMIDTLNIPKDMYEFQMLFGVTPKLRQSIVERGHRMRIYVPYGVQWFGYSTRRLKENPTMVWHIIKALFIRK